MILKYLLEALDAGKEVSTADDSKSGVWEKTFKADGKTYRVNATTIAGDKKSDSEFILSIEDVDTNMLSVKENSPEFMKAMVEVVKEWIDSDKPTTVTFNTGDSEGLAQITSVLKTAFKSYTMKDTREDREDEDNEDKAGKVIFTKVETAETKEAEPIDTEKKLDDNKKTFDKDVDEKVEENPKTGFNASDKLGSFDYSMPKSTKEMKPVSFKMPGKSK